MRPTTSVLLPALFLLTVSCQSQPLPPGDLAEIEKSKSVLAENTCEDLREKAADESFSLRGLAAVRALARCEGFTYDLGGLSDLERRLYAGEIAALESAKNSKPAPVSAEDLRARLKKEKDPQAKADLYRQLRLFYRKAGNRADMAKAADEAAAWAQKNYRKNKKSEDSYPILYTAAQRAARDHWTADEAAAATRVIDGAVRLLRRDHSVAELLFLKGRILEEGGQNKEASAQYDLAQKDVEKFNPPDLSFNTDRLRWLKAWILYKEKKHAAAEQAFAELVNATEDLAERSRALFYQARCLKSLDQPVQAKILLESITRNDFFSYYGLVAYRELDMKFPALKSLKAEGAFTYDLKQKFLSDADRELFRDLLRYREYGLAERAAGLLAKSPEEELNLGLFLAREHELYLPLFRAFSHLDNDRKVDVFLRYPELVFPRPYEKEVATMAEKTKLPASLIYSIMKQESAFNEKALSGAGAMGLMQVVPPLARQLAGKFDVPYSRPADLFRPAVNIQLGSYELMEQVNKQSGQLTFVAAAYNAGPGALAGWLKNRKRDDILEFIEEIPYEETRTYVKLIARNNLFYERISNRDTPQAFPAGFLN